MKTLIGKIEKNSEKLRKKIMATTAVLITDEEYDELMDVVYEAPKTFDVSKDWSYSKWVILRIDNGVAHLGGMGEDFGEFKRRHIIDFGIDELVTIGNWII